MVDWNDWNIWGVVFWAVNWAGFVYITMRKIEVCDHRFVCITVLICSASTFQIFYFWLTKDFFGRGQSFLVFNCEDMKNLEKSLEWRRREWRLTSWRCEDHKKRKTKREERLLRYEDCEAETMFPKPPPLFFEVGSGLIKKKYLYLRFRDLLAIISGDYYRNLKHRVFKGIIDSLSRGERSIDGFP